MFPYLSELLDLPIRLLLLVSYDPLVIGKTNIIKVTNSNFTSIVISSLKKRLLLRVK